MPFGLLYLDPAYNALDQLEADPSQADLPAAVNAKLADIAAAASPDYINGTTTHILNQGVVKVTRLDPPSDWMIGWRVVSKEDLEVLYIGPPMPPQ
jgi:hypothetical protein